MQAIACPLCGETAEPAAVAAGLAICGCCGATLRTDNDTIRAAAHRDVDVLSEDDLHALTRARRLLTRRTKTLRDTDRRLVEKARGH